MIADFQKKMIPLMSGKAEGTFDSIAQPFLKLMCREVDRQKKRLGGDLSVAYLVESRKSRDLCREACPDIVFITLTLTPECREKRLRLRHGEQYEVFKDIMKIFDGFEPAGDDEERAHNITVTEDMTKEDVLNKALEIISKI